MTGTTYNYTITSATNGGATSVTGSGSVTSTAEDITGIDVSALPDGILTYSVTLTDALGNAGAAATTTAQLDTGTPSGYSITADQTTITNSQATAAGFTFANATTGTTYNYSVTSSGDNNTASVTGSGSVTSPTQDVTGIDVSALSNGTLSFSVTLTDALGNTGTAAPAAATLSGLAVTSTPPTAATVGQVYSYQVQTNALAGDVVTITPSATLPAGTVAMSFDAADNTFTWTPSADEAGKAQTFSATLSDTAGNSITLGPVYVAVAAANGLTVIAPPADIAVGSPVLVAAESTNGGTGSFSVSTSDPGALTATLMPQSNPVLQIVTNLGTMEFQLLGNYTPNTVAHFEDLVNAGTYSNTTFYRIIQTFMDQGGVNGSTGSTIPDELNADLRFTSSGLLSMANDGVDGNSSEFFITNPDDTSNGFLDFRYTIFGKLISGDNVRAAIAATPVEENSAGTEDSQPVTPPVIKSISIVSEPGDGVILLKAQAGATAGSTYTVNVTDPAGVTQSFTITVGTNSYDPPNPWVDPINGTDTITIPAAANASATFTPKGESADGTPAPQIDVQLFRAVPDYPGYVRRRLLRGQRHRPGGARQRGHDAHQQRRRATR